MGIFDFLKKKKPKEKEPPKSFEEADSIFKKKSEELDKREKEVFIEIEKKLEDFYESVEEKLKILNEVDIESKKEHKKALILVRQGVDKYTNSVHSLLKDLKCLNKNDLEKFSKEIAEVFIHFEKKSSKFYERATYLVGDETLAVRNKIREFYNVLLEFFKEEKSLLEGLKRIKEVNSKLDEIRSIESDLKKLNNEILANNQDIKKAKEDIKKLNNEIKNIKNSPEHILNLKTKEKVRRLEVRLNNEISKLKELIDFKKLIGIVHSNQKEMEIAKNYKNNFVSEFSHNKKKLLDLLEGSNMKSKDIENQVWLIEKLESDLAESRKNIRADLSVVKLEKSEKIKDKIENIEDENSKLKKNREKFDSKLGELKRDVVRIVAEF